MMLLFMHNIVPYFLLRLMQTPQVELDCIIILHGIYKTVLLMLEWLIYRKFEISYAQFIAFTQHPYDDVLCMIF